MKKIIPAVSIGVMLLAMGVAAAQASPSITSWHNTKTADNQTSITVPFDQQIHFSVYAEGATQWEWKVDGIPVENNSFPVLSMRWQEQEIGNHTVSAKAGNSEGWSSTITWNVTVREPTPTEYATRYYNPNPETWFGIEAVPEPTGMIHLWGDNWAAFEISPWKTMEVHAIGLSIGGLLNETNATDPPKHYHIRLEKPFTGELAWEGAEYTLEMPGSDVITWKTQGGWWKRIPLNSPGTVEKGKKYWIRIKPVENVGDMDNNYAFNVIPVKALTIEELYNFTEETLYFASEALLGFVNPYSLGDSLRYSNGTEKHRYLPLYMLLDANDTAQVGMVYWGEDYPDSAREVFTPDRELTIDSIGAMISGSRSTWSEWDLYLEENEGGSYVKKVGDNIHTGAGNYQLITCNLSQPYRLYPNKPSQYYAVWVNNTAADALVRTEITVAGGRGYIDLGPHPELTWGGTEWISPFVGKTTRDLIILLHIHPVVSHWPQGSNTPVNSKIIIAFNKPMNKTATESAFSISPSVSGTFSWSGHNGNILVFTPSEDLSPNTEYTVTLGTGACGDTSDPWSQILGDNLRAPYNFSFTTGEALTTGNIAGKVTNTTGFPIENATVQADEYSTTTNSTGGYIIPDIPVGNCTVTAYKYGYEKVSKSVKVLENQTITVDFQLPVATPSTILAHSPSGTNVSVNATMSVTFSGAMNKTSAENAFSISPPINGSFSWSGNTMIFIPAFNLAYNTTYNITISEEAKDLNGIPMQSKYSWEFITASDTTPPVITDVKATVSTNSATITWSTDEEADTRVTYATSPEALGSVWKEKSELVKSHSVILTGLNESTTYYYRVYSRDAAGNTANSSVFNFTTLKAGAWWNTSWQYRRAITINNSGSGNLTDYQVEINVDYDEDMKEDFTDLRFATHTGVEIPYWVKNYTASTTATVWLKVPDIPVGETTIYMYYGNPSALSKSNGTAVFEFFDDYSSNSSSQYDIGRFVDDWLGAGVYQPKYDPINERVEYDTGDNFVGGWKPKNLSMKNLCAEVTMGITGSYDFDTLNGLFVRWKSNTEFYGIKVSGGYYGCIPGIIMNGKSGESGLACPPTNTYHPEDGTPFSLKIMVWNSHIKGVYNEDKPDEVVLEATNTSITGAGQVVITVGQAIGWFDDFRVRKYTEPEPVCSVGAEEIKEDTTPPASISDLQNTTGTTWINWTWTNPSDNDFAYTMVYLNGVFKTNTSSPYYNATNLTANNTYGGC